MSFFSNAFWMYSSNQIARDMTLTNCNNRQNQIIHRRDKKTCLRLAVSVRILDPSLHSSMTSWHKVMAREISISKVMKCNVVIVVRWMSAISDFDLTMTRLIDCSKNNTNLSNIRLSVGLLHYMTNIVLLM